MIFSPSHDAKTSKFKSSELKIAPSMSGKKTNFLKLPAEFKAEKYWPRRLVRVQTQGLFGQSISGYKSQ